MDKPKRKTRNVNETAFRTVQIATGQIPNDSAPEPPRQKNPAAVALGKLGASRGGKARAAKLTPARRRKIAKKAARARWSMARPHKNQM
jgi:hypothetical protein